MGIILRQKNLNHMLEIDILINLLLKQFGCPEGDFFFFGGGGGGGWVSKRGSDALLSMTMG